MPRGRRAVNWRVWRVGLACFCVLASAAGAADAFAEFALLHPAKDATLVEDPPGALANGSGDSVFAGRINAGARSIRRALLAFDVAAAVPAGSSVTGATLRLNLSSTSAGPVSVRLHRVVADWGEGASVSGGGGGAPATPGDSTWLYRFFADLFWAQPGGDFDAIPHADAMVDQPGPHIWGSTPEMVADVQSWLDQPGSAFGWILLGDESRPQTVKRFDSREAADETNQPLLEVDFVPPCAPNPAGPGYWQRQCANPAANFRDWVVPCAQRYLSDLGLPEVTACGAVLAPPPRDCTARAERKLAVLLLNVCAARLQTSCPVDAGEDGCSATTVGDRILEVSGLIREGDCRAASGCSGTPD